MVHQRFATSLSRLPVRNDALGDFWIPVRLFVDQPKQPALMRGVDFLKEHRCVIVNGKDLIQHPMQSEMWVASVCVESWLALRGTVRSTLGGLEHENTDKLLPQGMIVWHFLIGNMHLPNNVNVREKDH